MLKISSTRFCFLLTLALCSFMMSGVSASDLQTKTGVGSGELYKIDFPPPFVDAALKTENIPLDKVEKITSLLQAKHDFIHEKAKEIGAKRPVRNPFDYPPMEDAIADIFHDVCWDVYSSVMKSNGIQDEKVIQDSFEYIQQQKVKDYVIYQHSMESPKGHSQGH